MRPALPLLGCLLVCVQTFAAERESLFVTLNAGAFDRRESVVMFQLPGHQGNFHGVKLGKRTLPLQVGKDGRAWFVLPELKQGQPARGELMEFARPTEAVAARRDESKLMFVLPPPAGAAAGVPVIEYQAEPGALPRPDIKPIYRRGGYLHPIRTLSGKVITDDYPANHLHHHGIWWAWTSTEFQGRKPDFWNVGQGKGRVEFVELPEHWSGPVHAGFRARHRFVDLLAPEPVTALHETWEVRVYAHAGSGAAKYWMFDVVSEQKCATPDALKLPEYHYGGLGFRGNWAWNGKTNVNFLTSEGETDRVKGHATRARWCDISGALDGTPAGIAFLCHPGNYRAPQPMRIHPSEPFFNFAPQQAGDMEIPPGGTYVSRYRCVVHDGPPNRAELDRLWWDYAEPVTVTVK